MATDNVPIDIHYNKLLDWLISRRHCKYDWQVVAIGIREKINNAIQDMPAVEEITHMLQGTYINYFHCLKIVELLKETEAGTRNIFGRYSSKRMKDWKEIVSLYETDGVNLAEVAQLLTRMVNYEIPSLKRQIAKCKQTHSETERKEKDYQVQAAELKDKFQASCREMGIAGTKVKTELVNLLSDLPDTFCRIAASTKEVRAAVKYYEAFMDYTLNNKTYATSCTPLIRYVIQHGNTTVYQYKHGEKPSEVIEPSLYFNLEEEEVDTKADAEEIDWSAIDFDASSGADIAEIDFDEDIQIDVVQDVGEGNEAVDWGVTIETPLSTAGQDTDARVAQGLEALSIFDNVHTRNQFVDELLELQAFLEQRLHEMTGNVDVLTSSQLQSAPESLQVSAADIEKLKNVVKEILNQLTSTKIHHLFLIKSSPRYVDRLAEKLKQTLSLSEKMLASQRLMVIKRSEADEERDNLIPKLDIIRQKTKELQSQIEKSISEKYNSRPVNIMGEINII